MWHIVHVLSLSAGQYFCNLANVQFLDAFCARKVWFAVSDTGIGIAESANQRIFQPFQQADETVMNRFGGTGLGLSICKQLTEQVDGDINLKSQIGEGSTFRIEIPVETLAYSVPLDDSHAASSVNVLAFGHSHRSFCRRHRLWRICASTT
jgi:signal transduction histidine kinase